MSMFTAFNISASGMTAQRLRTDTIAQNLANVNTTSTSNGKAYVRKTVVFAERENMSFDEVLKTQTGLIGNGVKVTKIVKDTSTPMNMVYDPSHPDADENGYVTYPNVNTVTEMTNLIDASRSYEANATAFDAAKSMATTGLNIGSN